MIVARMYSKSWIFAPFLLAASIAAAQTPATPPTVEQQLDQIAPSALKETGVPSAVIAIVKDGKIALVKAYGDARIEPPTPANPRMRYGIGSISKQFTAAAVMMLVEESKLSLDDHVSKFFPELTRANEITLRELLSHTSGYQDNFPQDYLPKSMEKPTTAQHIMDTWAKKPLDFEPGTRWQYSNTGFTVAGAIVEKVSGVPLGEFLKQRILVPLGMTSASLIDAKTPSDIDVNGYYRHALGPARKSGLEAPGWLSAAGELQMTVEDLAKWNISVMNESLLRPSSYREMEREVVLKNGLGTRYGLGLTITSFGTHRVLEHGGEIIGFVAENIILPDDKAAVSVLTNMDASSAAGTIGQQIARQLIRNPDPTGQDAVGRARKVFEGLQRGTIDRTQFTDDANGYFDQQGLEDYGNSLGPLGAIAEFTANPPSERGGMIHRSFRVRFEGGKSVSVNAYETKEGKYEQFLVEPAS